MSLFEINLSDVGEFLPRVMRLPPRCIYGLGMVIGAVMALVLLRFVITNIENFKIAVSWVLDFVGRFWGDARYFAAEFKFEGKLNKFTDKVYSMAEVSGKHKVDLQWVGKRESVEGFFEDGKVVIRIKDLGASNRNLVSAMMIYVSTAVLPRSKKRLSKVIITAIDLYLGKELFKGEKPEVEQIFYSDYLQPTIDNDSRIQDIIDNFEFINRAGYFFPVLVHELDVLGIKVMGRRHTQEVNKEVKDLILYLKGFAESAGGEGRENKFLGRYLRCAIMIIARSRVKEAFGAEPYTSYIGELLENGFEDIYMVGRISYHEFMEEISNRALSEYGMMEVYKKSHESRWREKLGEWEYGKVTTILLRKKGARYYYTSEDEPPSLQSLKDL